MHATSLTINSEKARALVEREFTDSIIPSLCDYIRLKFTSPAFDENHLQNGDMRKAIALLAQWSEMHSLPGATVEVVELPGYAPLLFVDIPGTGVDGTILGYGHYDKQPPMTGWRDGFGPYDPIIEGDGLYGRGGADDGYAIFALITAVKVLREQGVPHARVVLIIEGAEESGSPGLRELLEHLEKKIGNPPDVVICLDSGAGNYEQMWITTSLRGLVMGDLRVDSLTEGVHSGMAGGVVPSTFRVARSLLSRLEDEDTGNVFPEWLQVEIPPQRVEEARELAEFLGDGVHDHFPFVKGARPVSDDPVELILNNCWRAAGPEIIGAGGLAVIGVGNEPANMMRPSTSLRVSLRLPPGVNGAGAAAKLKKLFEDDPPYGCSVQFEGHGGYDGFQAPAFAPWLLTALRVASQRFFGSRPSYFGVGGTIPFAAMLADQYPGAQVVCTGLLGPESHAHGPNERLSISTAKKLTMCIAEVIARHAARDTADRDSDSSR